MRECQCAKCTWDRESPIYGQLADETVAQQGWGPSFAIPWLNIAAWWNGRTHIMPSQYVSAHD
jgi:hypothetical protein